MGGAEGRQGSGTGAAARTRASPRTHLRRAGRRRREVHKIRRAEESRREMGPAAGRCGRFRQPENKKKTHSVLWLLVVCHQHAGLGAGGGGARRPVRGVARVGAGVAHLAVAFRGAAAFRLRAGGAAGQRTAAARGDLVLPARRRASQSSGFQSRRRVRAGDGGAQKAQRRSCVMCLSRSSAASSGPQRKLDRLRGRHRA